MKKIFVLMLAIMMCLAIFVGCGSKEPKTDGDASQGEAATAADITGEVFDAGEVSALVPSGWKAFPVADVFAEEDDATKPTAIQIAKDAESEWDLFSKPYVRIDYYGPDSTMITPSKDWYDDAEDLSPITTGDYTWNGFTASSVDVPMAVLWTEDGDNQYQVTVWLEVSEGKISLEDADVQAILASVAPSAQ